MSVQKIGQHNEFLKGISFGFGETMEKPMVEEGLPKVVSRKILSRSFDSHLSEAKTNNRFIQAFLHTNINTITICFQPSMNGMGKLQS